jgi:hypothetical protein
LGDVQDAGKFLPRKKGRLMSVILIFVAFVLAGDAGAVGISYLFERISGTASLMVFFVLWAFVFWAAWKLAVYVTERYIVRQN